MLAQFVKSKIMNSVKINEKFYQTIDIINTTVFDLIQSLKIQLRYSDEKNTLASELLYYYCNCL